MIKALLELLGALARLFGPKPKDERLTKPDVIANRNAVEHARVRRDANAAVAEAVAAEKTDDPERRKEALDEIRRRASL